MNTRLLDSIHRYYTDKRIMSDLYGPAARKIRLAIVRNAGLPDTAAQWGNFRRALADGLGIVGDCIADTERQIDALVYRTGGAIC